MGGSCYAECDGILVSYEVVPVVRFSPNFVLGSLLIDLARKFSSGPTGGD
jgi:hypothetical protein